MKTLLCFLLLCSVLGTLHAQEVGFPTARVYHEAGMEPPEHLVDMLTMRVEVSFAPEAGLVRGRVTHTFRPLRERVDSLFFHGPGIRIQQAVLNGSPVPFTQSPDGIIVRCSPALRWDATDTLLFVYEANPRRGLYFVGWKDTTGRNRRQIWSQGQGIDNRHWIPCFDLPNDKVRTEVIVRFDSTYRVLSNGALVSRRGNPDGTATWHYRLSQPHATYLVMLGIGRYAVDERRSTSGVPLHLWYYPDAPATREPGYRYTERIMDFLEADTGIPYPWESYAQLPVQDFLYGGMENTTATVFGDFLLVDERGYLDRNYLGVNAHEMAHQWFGDCVTARSGPGTWLQESFATYFTKRALGHLFGADSLEWVRRSEHEGSLAASRENRVPIVHSHAGSARVYGKGSAVLDMLRYVYGEEPLRRVIRAYVARHAYENVETNDLYQAFQDVLGVTPDWFFEEWLYRGGEPHYEVSHREVTVSGARSTEITVRQTHVRDELVGLFRMPVVLEVHYSDGSVNRVTATIQEATERVVVPNQAGKGVSFVLFDPGSEILKKVTFPKEFAELSAQARGAAHVTDRYDALVGLRTAESARKRALLLGRAAQERFAPLRAEVIRQLADDEDPAARRAVAAAFQDPVVDVRSAALTGRDTIPSDLRDEAERLLHDPSYQLSLEALLRLSAQFPSSLPAYLAATQGVRGVGNQVSARWHELNVQAGNRASLDTLVDWAGPSFDFRTRQYALEALQRLNVCTDAAADHLLDALVQFNGRLRGPAVDVARHFLRQTATRTTLLRRRALHTWDPHQEALLNDAFAVEGGK
jgi:aminopeptidase N